MLIFTNLFVIKKKKIREISVISLNPVLEKFRYSRAGKNPHALIPS